MSHRETDEKQRTREDEQELLMAKETHDKKTPFKQSMKGTFKQSRNGKTVQQTEDDEYTYEDYLCETFNEQYNDQYNDRYLLEDREQTKQQAKKSTASAKKEEEEYTYEDYCEDERCAHYNDQCVREDREQSRARYGLDRRCR